MSLIATGSPFWPTAAFGFGMQLNLMLVFTRALRGTSLGWPAAQEPSQ